jgi:hypothetical protein
LMAFWLSLGGDVSNVNLKFQAKTLKAQEELIHSNIEFQ